MIYTIPQGSHYTTNRSLGGMHLGIRSMRKSVRFTASCLYQFTDPKCVDDINKLFGFSYGMHHTNSVRVGWRCKDGIITLFAYCYRNGLVSTKYLTRIKIDNYYDIEIYVGQGYVRFTTNGVDKFLTLDYTPAIGYNLLPYFGGDCIAPHDMLIEINQP